jgi:hypothetical protein
LQSAEFKIVVDAGDELDLLQISDFLNLWQLSIYRAVAVTPILFDDSAHSIVSLGETIGKTISDWGTVVLTAGELEKERVVASLLEKDGRSKHVLHSSSKLILGEDQFSIALNGIRYSSPIEFLGQCSVLVISISILLGGGDFEITYEDNVLKVKGTLKSLGSAIADYRRALAADKRVTRAAIHAAERIEPNISEPVD